MTNELILGIDLGSTQSCLGYFDGEVNILNIDGKSTLPSCIAILDDQILVGEEAYEHILEKPKCVLYDIKRIIGKNFDDKELQKDCEMWSFTVEADENGKAMITVPYKETKKSFYPEEISSFILKKLKHLVEEKTGKEAKNVVITVPAYFTDSQRNATKEACIQAGFENVLRIINEPTAGALAYGYNNPQNDEDIVLVMDGGGCTWDISVLSIEAGFYEVLGTSGLIHLGGEDFTNCLMRKVVEKYVLEIKNDVVLQMKLRNLCEETKQTLSQKNISKFLFNETEICITREEFEESCSELFNSAIELVQKALQEAKVGKSQIHRLIMIGGSTRIPKLRQMLSDEFNGKEVFCDINADEAIAYGATIQSAILQNVDHPKISQMLLADVTSLSIGVESANKLFNIIVPKNSLIPCVMSKTFTTFYDNQDAVSIVVLKVKEAQWIIITSLGVLTYWT